MAKCSVEGCKSLATFGHRGGPYYCRYHWERLDNAIEKERKEKKRKGGNGRTPKPN